MAHAATATVFLRRPLLLSLRPTRLLSSHGVPLPHRPHPRALRPISPLPSDAEDLDRDSGDGAAVAFRRSRNEMKREARRAVQWGMELAKFSPAQIKRIVRAASLEREVLDALMLVKKFGPDVREGRRRQFNYIGRLLRSSQPELMDTLIQASKDGDDSKLQALLSEDTMSMEDEEVEDLSSGEEGDEEYMEMADRWFDGLLSKDVSVTNEVYGIHNVEFDRQDLRKLVRRVHMVYESTRNKDGCEESDMKLSRAKEPLLMFLRNLAKKTCPGFRILQEDWKGQVGARISPMPGPISFKCENLELIEIKLHLYGVSLDNRFAELLCSGGPVLEDLAIKHCSNCFREITSHTLKKLVINACIHLTEDPLIINALRLAYLQLGVSCGLYSSGILIHVTASLVEAAVYLLCLGEMFSLKNQHWLLHDLRSVPNFDLSAVRTMATHIEKSDGLPIFPNMRNLLLQHCFLDKCDLNDKLDALGNFVQNAPCLEKLTLQCCMFQVDPDTDGQLVRKNVILQCRDQNTFKCENLKLTEVMYEEDHDHQLVELFWGIGRRLPDASY